ncbi:hypothetical protein [Streptomyces swartbergensis]|uniref:Exonuclease domain-containing protein n=1 Tax=Streptomyces swartbergensis TaxID=487165 RepID=A0A243S737_9ACTN|nr:hypothetical protein [Streptomyces swartbergensis]OUD03363.1 hypothetical protein CA983_10155 [Streptomyces swartbergensis]
MTTESTTKRTTPLAFVDCETTHLDAEIGEVWEVAVILREQDGDETTDTEYVWQFSVTLAGADPEALRIGRFHERRQLPTGEDSAAFTGQIPAVLMSSAEAVKAIVNVLSGAVMIGSNPGFDDRHLRKLLGPGAAQWHYRPVDIATLAAGFRLGLAASGVYGGDFLFPGDYPQLPFKSYELSRAVGVEPPAEEAAHTALGDARWARDVYDAIADSTPMRLDGIA